MSRPPLDYRASLILGGGTALLLRVHHLDKKASKTPSLIVTAITGTAHGTVAFEVTPAELRDFARHLTAAADWVEDTRPPPDVVRPPKLTVVK